MFGISMGRMGLVTKPVSGAAPPPATGFNALSSSGTVYPVTRTVLDSTGASYSVGAAVLSSTGTSYNPI